MSLENVLFSELLLLSSRRVDADTVGQKLPIGPTA